MLGMFELQYKQLNSKRLYSVDGNYSANGLDQVIEL